MNEQQMPEISGSLYKKRGGFGKMMPNAWQYRFFTVTKEGILQYFDNIEVPDAGEIVDSKARGRLDLRSVLEVTIEPIEGAPTQFPVQISIPSEERWKLCADTQEEQLRWCKVLEKFSAKKSKLNVPAPLLDEGKQLKDISSIDVNVPQSPTNFSAQISSPTSQSVSNDSAFRQIETESSIESPIIVSQPAKTTSHHKTSKKRLKLGSQKSFFDQEWTEWILVTIILNISFFGIIVSRNTLPTIVFILIGNCIVAYSLMFRSGRIVKDHEANKSSKIHPNVLPSSSFVEGSKKNKEVEELSDHPSVKDENLPITDSLPTTTIAGSKPTPGHTYPRAEGDPRSAPPHTWSFADSRQFNVRVGPDYNKNKRKAASSTPFYEPFAVDVFCAKSREDHVARKFQLPDTSDINTYNKFVPPIFVIQIQIPTDPPASFFTTNEDGPGWAVVMYFRITEDTCNQLKDITTASPAVKLFAEWCEKSPTDPLWRGRFKVINSCTNLDELGFPSLIVSYNAKPVLIRRTGTIFRGDNYMEMNLHVHKFANVAKQSIHLLSSRCSQLYMQIGFVIEGREDKELPENLFACVAINRPQEDQAEFIFDD